MPRTPSANNATEFARQLTRPHWLMQLGFSTVVRFSSRGTVTFNGNTYAGVDMEVELALDGLSGSFRFFDENYTYLPRFISEGSAGISVQAWAIYGDNQLTPGNEDEYFDGELGPVTERDGWVSAALVQPESRFAPNIYITTENGFNHLPPDGTEIATQNGIIVLRKE